MRSDLVPSYCTWENSKDDPSTWDPGAHVGGAQAQALPGPAPSEKGNQQIKDLYLPLSLTQPFK